MDVWTVVWLIAGLVTILIFAALLVGLVRQALLLGRSVTQLQGEIAPIIEELSRMSQRAAGLRSPSQARPQPPG